MAPAKKKKTAGPDYERQRQENIRRNSEIMAALLLGRTSGELSSLLKTQNIKKKKKPQNLQIKKKPAVAPQSPRRSLRFRGLPPESISISNSSLGSAPARSVSPRKPAGRFPISDCFLSPNDSPSSSSSSSQPLIQAILSASVKERLDLSRGGVRERGERDIWSDLVLREGNVRKVIPDRIMVVKFLPATDRTIVLSGNKHGHLGFCDFDFQSANGEKDEVFVYFPHRSPVSGISVHPDSVSKIYSSSYDGDLCLMDAEREIFNMVYSSQNTIFSLCQSPIDSNSLFLGEGPGKVKAFDQRSGKIYSTWDLHEQRINTIDFNLKDSNLFATSSTDGSACIWDLRNMNKNKPESLRIVQQNRAVHSAYFSPTGSSLATTSIDDTVRIFTGTNLDSESIIKHNNQTGRWLSSFRAIWGWSDSYLYIGNMKRAIDVISTHDKSTIALESENMTTIPCRFAANPYKEGSIACAGGSKIFLWTKQN